MLKTVNLIVTRRQREDGITPSQPVGTVFETCPKCSYQGPLPAAAQNPHSQVVLNAFVKMVDGMVEKEQEKEQKEHGTITQALAHAVPENFSMEPSEQNIVWCQDLFPNQ